MAKDANLNLIIDNVKIEQVEHTKFLGVIINSKLTRQDHIKLVSSNVSKIVGILSKIRYDLSSEILLMLYRTLVQPYFDYYNIIWATQNNYHLINLHRRQKKALRIIASVKWDAHTTSLFKKYGVLTIFDTIKLQTCCCVYKAVNNELLDRFSNLFFMNSDVHHDDARQRSKLHLVAHRLTVGANSIKVYGTKLWNCLINHITGSPSYQIFKKIYRKYLLDLM